MPETLSANMYLLCEIVGRILLENTTNVIDPFNCSSKPTLRSFGEEDTHNLDICVQYTAREAIMTLEEQINKFAVPIGNKLAEIISGWDGNYISIPLPKYRKAVSEVCVLNGMIVRCYKGYDVESCSSTIAFDVFLVPVV